MSHEVEKIHGTSLAFPPRGASGWTKVYPSAGWANFTNPVRNDTGWHIFAEMAAVAGLWNCSNCIQQVYTMSAICGDIMKHNRSRRYRYSHTSPLRNQDASSLHPEFTLPILQLYEDPPLSRVDDVLSQCFSNTHSFMQSCSLQFVGTLLRLIHISDQGLVAF